MQLARALSGIASGGVLRRPHVVFPDEVASDERAAIASTFAGSGDKTIPLTAANWQLITDAMAETLISGTAAPSHLEGIDFAGKTGTAQVVGHDSGKTGHKTIPNAWFVGMTPRRNPDIVVTVLWENGNWGANSAKLAAQVVDAFVTKQRKAAGNLRIAEVPKPAQVPAPTPANTASANAPGQE
jgi:penicillin-binding protein 2